MNEDYLWDKTGEDLEIKKLENALQAFRYTETMPLRLPVKAPIFEKKPLPASFNWWPGRLVFTAALSFGLILLMAAGVWFQLSMTIPNEVVVNIDKPSIILPDEPSFGFPITTKKVDDLKPVEIKQTPNQRIYKVRQTPPAIIRPKLLTAQNKKTNPTDVLTKEELYAYNQLMTALSITSYQLKQVKDKIQGIENQTAVVKGGR